MARTKYCSKCGKSYPIKEFHRRKKGADIRSSRCRFCSAKAQRLCRQRKSKGRDRRAASL